MLEPFSMTMQLPYRVDKLGFALLALAAVLAACGEKKEDNVWEQYDVRHPVPYNSQMIDDDVERQRAYSPYIDNDAYYSPPAAVCPPESPGCLD